jgi:hypothetical protein
MTNAGGELGVLFRQAECRYQELEVAAYVGDAVQVEAVAGGVYPAMRDAAGDPNCVQQFVRWRTTGVQERPFAERQEIKPPATK